VDIFQSVGDWQHVVRVLVRLLVAMGLGAVIGFQRELEGKDAGARTHMLVALGAAMPILFALEVGMALSDVSRVVQGVVTGIGFMGAGAILKVTDEHRIRGLTTAGSIWVTASIGMAAGAGALWPAIMAVVFAMVVLTGLHGLEKTLQARHSRREQRRQVETMHRHQSAEDE
jgi:putative Mg2+ transporter-C (MgtC) family protein